MRISVTTSKKYDILIEKGLLQKSGSLICERVKQREQHRGKLCVVTDETVSALYGADGQELMTSLREAGFFVHRFVFSGGETHKNMETVLQLLQFLAERQFSRSDILLGLGGGVTGDLTGFAAALYLRGVRYVQVPTTLLAGVDASIGGKTGVNLKAGKNLAGAFWQPSLVLFDPTVLATLSQTQRLDGFAEMIKIGMIGDDSIVQVFRELTGKKGTYNNLLEEEKLLQLISASIEGKRRFVQEDERDEGKRQCLNFGHTIGHAIEACSGYEISHGRAVAMGMVLETRACERLGWSQGFCSAFLSKLLQDLGFSLNCPYSSEALGKVVLQDKKIRGGRICLVVPQTIGACTLKTVSTSMLLEWIRSGTETV